MNANQITLHDLLGSSGYNEGTPDNTENVYRRLADLSPDMVTVLYEGSFIYINPAGADTLGANNPKELIGKFLREVLPAVESDFLLEQVQCALNKNRIHKFEYSLQLGKTKVWFDGSISPISQNSAVWTAHDITQYKQVEQEKAQLNAQIERQRQRLETIFANVPGVVWEAWGEPDADTQRIDFVSEYAETMLGYSIEEWLTTPNFWLSIVHPEDKESAVLNAAKTFTSREAGTNHFRWITKDDRVIWVEVKSVAIRDESGKPIGMRGVATDISERKQAEELRLRRARQSALRAEISVAFARQEPLQAILQQCAEALVQNLDAALARIWMLNTDENILELCASAGLYTQLDGAHARIPIGELKIGMIAEERKPHLTGNLQNDELIGDKEWAEEKGIVAFAGYPLMVENRLVGVMAMFSREPLVEDTLEGLAVFAGNIAQGIELKRVEQALAQSEAQLRQSRRLESVGRWAGGIAHDFNNMLTVINGYSELSLRRLKKDGPLRSNIEEIKKAGERSALLTYQLSAFSRQQVFKSETIDLNKVIGEVSSILQRLIGKDIRLITRLNSKLGCVEADRGQLSHLIMNLVVNARDAMPHGGTLTIETKNFTIDKEFTEQSISVAPGQYIKLSVGNTGIGIDKKTQQHVFEPFYTDTNVGMGTGLGLAMIYDTVKQSGGHIFVDGKAGTGTIFKIYLPRVGKKVE
jgi:PAS domain S-box-containing protein